MSYKVSVSETDIFPVTTNVFACSYDQNWFLRKKLKFMCWLGPALGPRSARPGPRKSGTGPAPGMAWVGLETSWKHPKHYPFMSQTPQKHLEKTFFQVILSRARANTWILTFSSKINFGRMNMRKRLLWPEICQFHSQKPYTTCRTLIFNFQRKSESSLFFH